MGYLVRVAFIIGTAALFAGCGGSQPPIGAPGAMPETLAFAPRSGVHRIPPAASFQTLHRFDGSDGEQPESDLINVNDTLYGTTNFGGSHGSGSVYKTTLTGTERVLYSFKSGADGSMPQASLIDVKGTFYGTTSTGGGSGCYGYGCGTVYKVNATGSEKVLHRFSGADGGNPRSDLSDVNGMLYGTTSGGGSSNRGTVYRISTTGVEKVLYSFAGGSDGESPGGGLIQVGGRLYGTTMYGGTSGIGTVYSVSTTGSEKVLHSFTASEGAGPIGNLVDVDGTLYGTTSAGGCHKAIACGTVFRTTPGGKLKVLHVFGSGSDGYSPYSGLTNVNGVLYGTTDVGGSGTGCYKQGCGTVYRVSTSGSEKVLHSFTGGSGGSNPQAALTNVNNTLYGTTLAGFGSSGCSGGGCGTIFALTP